MDYKALVHNNDEKRKCIEGICLEMCPPEEVILREKENLVHVLEVTESGYKLVKCYCRSAANSNMAVPHLLRPFPVLLDTVQYLLLKVSNRSDVKLSVMYDFLNDRLRAVRQDMTIQRLPPEDCAVLLEPMIRFYVYFGYRLCDYPLKDYDPVLNKKYLLECIKWFLNCCDIIQRNKAAESEYEKLMENFNALHISRNINGLSCDRVLVESLYVLCNLHDIHPLYRYLGLPQKLKRAPLLKLSYNIALANMNGNFIRAVNLSRTLTPLTFSAVCLHLPMIQRTALHVMSHAYNSKLLTLPAGVLRRWLAFNSDDETRSICQHYGLTAAGDVTFTKTSFKLDAEQPQQRKYLNAKILELKLDEVLSA